MNMTKDVRKHAAEQGIAEEVSRSFQSRTFLELAKQDSFNAVDL